MTTGWSDFFQSRTIRRELGYAQDVRYFAIEHMDVRREAFQVCTAHQIPILKDKCHGPGQPLDRFPASPPPNAGLRVACPETRFKLIPESLGRRHGPGQSLDRFPVSPSPCRLTVSGQATRIPA